MSDPADRDPVLMAVADGLAARLRHEIAGLETPAMRGDCLAVMLASDFEAWADEDEETDDSGTWKQSAVDATDGVLDSITGLCRDAIYAALLSERHRAEEAKWLPMDSAPKDGTRVLVAWKAFAGISEHVELGKWKQRDGWCNTYGKSFHGIPDYFMPLPALPLTPEPTHER